MVTSTAVMHPQSLRRNVVWSVAGNTAYAASQWAMLVVLSKLVSTDQVGVFAFALAVTAPVFLFTNLQLRAVQATDARGEHSFRTFLQLRFMGTILGMVFVGGLVAVRPHGSGAVLLGMAAAKSIESVSDVLYGLFQKRERMDIIARSMILKGALSLAALATCVALTRSVGWATAAMAAAWLASLLIYDVPNARRMLPDEINEVRNIPQGKAALQSLLVRALPLGIVTMILSLIQNVPRYYVEHFLGAAPLAVFAAMGYVMVAGSTVIGAMGQSASPRLARQHANGDRLGFRRTLTQLLLIASAIGVGAVLIAVVAGKPLLTLLYRPEYAAYPDAFVWLMGAAGLSYFGNLLGVAVTAMRWFRGQMYIHAASLPLVLVLNSWLVPKGGLLGASIALAVYGAVSTAVYGAVVIYLVRRMSPAVPVEVAAIGGAA